MSCVAVDLFCGIGGLTKGLSMSGINVVAGFDIDESCRFAYERNNDAKFLCKDITKITAEDIEKFYPENSIRILVGCAPCQPFSRYSCRYRKDGQRDEKWKLICSFERLVLSVMPDIVSMENVPQLANDEVFKDFVSSLNDSGYNVTYQVVYCPDYGIPQRRKRLVLLASQLGIIDFIKPLYNKGNYMTVRQAIGHLPAIKAGEVCKTDLLHQASALSDINQRRIEQSIPGGTWRDWDKDLQAGCHRKDTGRTYPSVYGRMKWDEPSPTITTQFYGYGNGRFGHPEQDRAISLREGAILQSFPDDYIFVDEEHPVRKRELGIHIGNAVPVKLGKVIGESIKKHVAYYKGGS